ncbi:MULTISPECIES: hypothetical protein [unclassified Streptomyces]|uniref:hypothetical protein n=1 Tax=unclassified Streptomyces TaxID=2593676 RepID=UPI00381E84C7
MRETIAVIGWITCAQGALGFAGLTFGDNDWGMLHRWFELSNGAYLVVAVVGLVVALAGESARRANKLG